MLSSKALNTTALDQDNHTTKKGARLITRLFGWVLQDDPNSKTRRKFFEIHWELKIIPWGLVGIAIASAIRYLIAAYG